MRMVGKVIFCCVLIVPLFLCVLLVPWTILKKIFTENTEKTLKINGFVCN